MTRYPARVLEPDDVRRLLSYASATRQPQRNALMIQLNFKAGLRACEMAGLTWPMALKTNGQISEQVSISRNIAKYGSARRIPVHPDLRDALHLYHRQCERPSEGPVLVSERGGHLTPRSIVNWFHEAYAQLGLTGCSSHSGRRTFITRAARIISKTGGSLRDVQELAGHRALTTTERYIQGDRDAQRKLIALL